MISVKGHKVLVAQQRNLHWITSRIQVINGVGQHAANSPVSSNIFKAGIVSLHLIVHHTLNGGFSLRIKLQTMSLLGKGPLFQQGKKYCISIHTHEIEVVCTRN